jgi:hypothetical protein
MASKAAREKWNAEHYRQINISVSKELAEEFKSLCGGNGVSVAGALKSFMKERLAIQEERPRDDSGAGRPSRGRRRKEVTQVIAQLEKILADEECYLDHIPENLQGGIRAEAAAHSLAMLSEAIDLLVDAYP